MKKLISILTFALLFVVACQKSEPNTEVEPQVEPSLTYSQESIGGHEAIIVKPSSVKSISPVVVILTDDLELKTRAAEQININFKAAEHCLIGNYILCVIKAEANDDITFLSEIKNLYPRASRLYLLSYCNGLAYTAAMVMPDVFNAYACVSGAIEVEAYKTNSFGKPVSFMHVHATDNSVYKWNGVENKSVSVPLSVGAIVAVNDCITYKTSELLAREGKGRVTCTHYTGSQSGRDVKFYTVEGASNGWCDGEFEVYNQVWNFFKAH